jgi:hypothetical protein
MVFNWYGHHEGGIKAGDFMWSPGGDLFWVQSAKPVKVKVTRGETLRQRLELIPWPQDELPPGARVTRWWREPRHRKPTRRLS